MLCIMNLEPTTPAANYQRAVKETKALIDGSSRFTDAQEKFNLIINPKF